MKFNWKILVAVIVLIVAVIWGVNSLLPRSYSGTELDFGIGKGVVKITNPSDTPLPVQLVSDHANTYAVSTNIEGVSGRSIVQRNGNTSTQIFDFTLPPGTSEITVARGNDVRFVSNSDTSLKAIVQPLSASDARTTLIAVIIVVLGALFYLSSTNDHRWISASRRRKAVEQAAEQEAERKNFNRMYGRDSSD